MQAMDAARQEQYIEVGIENEKYAIRIGDIHEIIKGQHITEIPDSLPFVSGVINLRGKVVLVISLRKRFGLAEAPHTKASRIVVVKYADETVGLSVDRVYQVKTYSKIQPPMTQTGVLGHGSYFSGIGQTGEELVCILNLARVIGE